MARVAKWFADGLESLLGSRMPLMNVVQTQYLSCQIKKVRFEGTLAGMNFYPGHAVAIRVSETEYRNYTPSFSDTRKGLLEIIFHLHGIAPGSRFADNLKVGDKVRISMPRGPDHYDPRITHQILFGDETSLGMACSFLPVLKRHQHKFLFCFELDRQNSGVPEMLGLENVLVLDKKQRESVSTAVPDLITGAMPDWKTAGFILTGNAESVQKLRKVIKSRQHTGKIFSKGYWLEGKQGL